MLNTVINVIKKYAFGVLASITLIILFSTIIDSSSLVLNGILGSDLALINIGIGIGIVLLVLTVLTIIHILNQVFRR